MLLAASVVLGHAVLLGADERLLSVSLAFAGGAVLASLADTLMPDSYREGGSLIAFATAAGFFFSFMIENVRAAPRAKSLRVPGIRLEVHCLKPGATI